MIEEEIEKELTAKQKRFCEEYSIDFNATQSAIRAGYSEKTAYSIGNENLKKPEIKKYISEILERKTLGPEGTKKLITDIATGNLNNYYKKVLVEEVPKVRKPLAEIIDGMQESIIQDEIYCERVGLTGQDFDEFQERIDRQRKQIIRLEIELERNPDAYRIVSGEPELVERMELDMEKLVADKEKGRIKSIKHTQYGVQVELYGADGALTNLARIHGLFNDKVDLTTNGESLNKPMSQEEAKLFLEELKKENGV
jgi:phage terminase small subunit